MLFCFVLFLVQIQTQIHFYSFIVTVYSCNVFLWQKPEGDLLYLCGRVCMGDVVNEKGLCTSVVPEAYFYCLVFN